MERHLLAWINPIPCSFNPAKGRPKVLLSLERGACACVNRCNYSFMCA